jgi:predicted peptidase
MGGNGTWDQVSRRPEYFAAVAPMAAIPEIPDSWNKRFISMPIWAFHGDQDTICRLRLRSGLFFMPLFGLLPV